jgi:RNA polymerase sigma-70 factor (ECF subfamily)
LGIFHLTRYFWPGLRVITYRGNLLHAMTAAFGDVAKLKLLLNYDTQTDCTKDANLVERLQRGDIPAVEHVVREYAPALYRFACYQLHDAAAAEDLVAEVMSRMIGRINTYVHGEATFQAWLFRIARNLIADHYRAIKRRPQVSLERWLDAEPASEPGREDAQLASLLTRDELQAGLNTLTDEQRQVVLLHVIEGWELPQVAQLLDRSVASVKSLYYRGVSSLKRVLLRHDLE